MQQDIENDPIIRDQMANLDCLLMHTIVNVFGCFSCCAYSQNLGLGNDWIETQHEQEEGYQSN